MGHKNSWISSFFPLNGKNNITSMIHTASWLHHLMIGISRYSLRLIIQREPLIA